MPGIFDAFDDLGRFEAVLGTNGCCLLDSGYYTPGYISVLTAFLKSRNVQRENFRCAHEDNENYLSALGLSKVLWGLDDYQYCRRNAGSRYARLTHISSRDAVDVGTEQINGCLRQMAAESSCNYSNSPAFQELLHVVGELHDNVWSHGLDSGFSTAQRRSDRSGNGLIEFSLADTGMGFLAELRTSGISRFEDITTHQEAIEWCIQEGHSSKLADHEDEWGQSLPEDHVGRNPFGNHVRTRNVRNGNHHQGLGLAKLLSLAHSYDGTLYLASGDAVLCLEGGNQSFRYLSRPWKGVAMSLTLEEAKLAAAQAMDDAADSGIEDIINLLVN